MFLQVPNLLTGEELTTLDAAVAGGTYIDGKETADTPTKPVKVQILKSVKILISGFWKAKILKSAKILNSGFWKA